LRRPIISTVSSFFARPENGTQYVPVERPQSGAIAACIYVRFDIMRTRFSTEQHVMNLKSMTIDALIGLRGKIDSVLGSKVAGERRALETELAKLSRFESGGSRSRSLRRGARGKVAPQFRNPENPGETWAGRGLKPRWLAAAIKSGKKLEDFRIAGSGKDGAAKPAKKKARAKRK
jgi:DNA-binding protein H-NS